MRRVKPRLAITKQSVTSAFDAVEVIKRLPITYDETDYIPGIWPDPSLLSSGNDASTLKDAVSVKESLPLKTLGVEPIIAQTPADLPSIEVEELQNNKNFMPKDTESDTPKDTKEDGNSESNLKTQSEPFGKRRILCLDPSAADTTGYCLIDLEWDEAGVLLKEDFIWGSWSLSGLNFLMRCVDLKDYILQDIGEFDELVVEWPMYYDSTKGAVASRQGYTINLAGIAMFIVGWFHIPHQQVFLYTAPDWKGTVPKQVTARRFFKMFNVNVVEQDEHAIDATMMGVYHIKKTLNANQTE
jgi:hypothetical protein